MNTLVRLLSLHGVAFCVNDVISLRSSIRPLTLEIIRNLRILNATEPALYVQILNILRKLLDEFGMRFLRLSLVTSYVAILVWFGPLIGAPSVRIELTLGSLVCVHRASLLI